MSEINWQEAYFKIINDFDEFKKLANDERVRFQEAVIQLTKEYNNNKEILEDMLSERSDEDRTFYREHTSRQTEAMEGILKELHRIENRMP